MRTTCAIALLALSLVLAPTPAAAAPPAAVQLAPGDLKWMPAPPVLPKGVQLAVLSGNPFAEGFTTLRLKIPPHTTFAPHWHPTAEGFTVLEGIFHVGMGDQVDKAAARALPAMSYASMPAMHHHYAYTEGQGVVIDLSFYGPFQIHYVHAADDPSAGPAVKH
ncbi:cupin domain-containing protein [Rhodanobacter lindaniclasticus]